jgi:alpha-1,6-mannosyltransferase
LAPQEAGGGHASIRVARSSSDQLVRPVGDGAAPSATTSGLLARAPGARWPADTVGLVALAVCVAGTALWIIAGDESPFIVRISLSCFAFCGFGALFAPRIRAATLKPRRIAVATAGLLLVAVAMPPTGSLDVWSYAMYGSMVSEHHASPYTHTPDEYPGDPLQSQVGPMWQHTPSVYGPAFVAVAAAGTSVAGSSLLLNRLFFQIIEALTVLAIMILLWRRTRDPAALAFVGLNPAVIAVVSGGHNDLLVGLALLAGTVLVANRRPGWAGVILAAGALVKLVAVLPVVALTAWTWRRRGRRDALVVAGTTGALTIGGYAAAGGQAALQPLLAARALIGRVSIWNPVHWLTQVLHVDGRIGTQQLGTTAIVVSALVIVVFIALVALRDDSPALTTGGATLVFLLTAAYVLPWYAAWGLPVVALVWRSRVAQLTALQAAILTLAYA